MAAPINVDGAAEHVIAFEAGLFGLPEETSFVLCDTDDDGVFQALVSVNNPALQILVVDAELVWPDFPVAEAHAAAGLDDPEVAVAAVVTANPGSPATVNLVAPLVIGLKSRAGIQLILDRDDLSVRHTLVAHGTGEMTAAPLS
jgi:flagellar assembly factor FliW